jgi:uncharacterized membrane protein YjgN (DUF898 family)
MSDLHRQANSAFVFHGRWQQFLPIAATNLLLTLVTLGIYRFWATTRERRYFWAQSEFIDERLEWTGTGKELLIGFVMVLLLMGIPLFIINFAAQALVLQGQNALAGILGGGAYLVIFYLLGIARFRALRYRLGRTYWHGIRGGSDDPGFKYGWSYMWKTFLGYLPFGLGIPWAMGSLWNERWNAMSFGPHQFRSRVHYADFFGRFFLFYLLPFAIFILIAAMTFAAAGLTSGGMRGVGAVAAVGAIVAVVGTYLLIGLVALAFYAKFFREAVKALDLHTLDLEFTARTMDWLKLLFGDAALYLLAGLVAALPVALVIGSMGLFDGLALPNPEQISPALAQGSIVGIFLVIILPLMLVGPFIRYRHWKFFITFMEAYGEINLDELTQSPTARSKHGEGLLDALDVGAL